MDELMTAGFAVETIQTREVASTGDFPDRCFSLKIEDGDRSRLSVRGEGLPAVARNRHGHRGSDALRGSGQDVRFKGACQVLQAVDLIGGGIGYQRQTSRLQRNRRNLPQARQDRHLAAASDPEHRGPNPHQHGVVIADRQRRG